MESKYAKQGASFPRIQHISLPISEGKQDAIRAFYTGILGMPEKAVPDSLGGRGLVWFEAGNGEMELHFIPDIYLAHPEEGRHFCLEVADLEEVRTNLKEAGHPIIETTPIPYRPRFFTLDPCGNHVELTTLLEEITA